MMMQATIESLNTWAGHWLEAMLRACWHGSLALLFLLAVCHGWPCLPAAVRCWLCRMAYMKLLILLLCAVTVDLPLLPHSPRHIARPDAVSSSPVLRPGSAAA